MPEIDNKKGDFRQPAKKDRVAEVANTLEWLITALILAFVFRAFIMEAYRIPTGSMADTLMGEHFRMRCVQCGYRYNYGSRNYGRPGRPNPRGGSPTELTRCPSCGYEQAAGGTMPVAKGDRILVLKCIYQFLEPKQWDVIVFKNPGDPAENYIKRLVGRPEETVEIIDGDIYIDGQISSKPPKVQKELWMSVYDNDYRPARPEQGRFNGRPWQQPFRNLGESNWFVDSDNPTKFRLDSPAGQLNTLIYDTSAGNDFKATYAYDDVRRYDNMPYCSDLMVRFYSTSGLDEGRVGATLTKYENEYSAWVDFEGQMVIVAENVKETVELARRKITPPAVGKPVSVKFANVDHRLIFEFGKKKLTCDLGRGADDLGARMTKVPPVVKVFGAGDLTLSHVAVFRDIHYLATRFGGNSRTGRATEGKPFTLGRDEFFVLGDNSPNSEDGRWWGVEGKGNNGHFYRAGIVPRDYLVGKALFVYWPSGFRFSEKVPLRVIPNIGQMRFIYGGSEREL
jgi:signal peptidase I